MEWLKHVSHCMRIRQCDADSLLVPVGIHGISVTQLLSRISAGGLLRKPHSYMRARSPKKEGALSSETNNCWIRTAGLAKPTPLLIPQQQIAVRRVLRAMSAAAEPERVKTISNYIRAGSSRLRWLRKFPRARLTDLLQLIWRTTLWGEMFG